MHLTLVDVTSIIIGSVTALLIAYDVWVAYKDPTKDATISWVLLSSSKKWPVIAFAFGFLMGHLFFQNCMVN